MEKRKKYRESIGRTTVPPGNLAEQVQYGKPTTEMWRTPDAHCDRGPSSEKRMKMKLDKGMPISLNDQVRHPNLMWPTPNHTDHLMNKSETLKAWEERAKKKKEEKGINLQFALRHAVQMWPTPRASAAMGEKSESIKKRVERRGRLGSKLEESVAMVPTPTARDYKDNGLNTNYQKAKEKNRLAGTAGGSLNPTWVEWLMGYPNGWTDLKD
tara:strand:- start:112 stop:747 length:636 start_codon:yes stop_codon:yes gene_type:complete